MQQKTHDFLVRMQVPMATFGGDLMGEAIDFAIHEIFPVENAGMNESTSLHTINRWRFDWSTVCSPCLNGKASGTSRTWTKM